MTTYYPQTREEEQWLEIHEEERMKNHNPDSSSPAVGASLPVRDWRAQLPSHCPHRDRDGLMCTTCASITIERLMAERDKWVALFNRSEQFQSGPTRRLEALQAALLALKTEMEQHYSPLPETVRQWASRLGHLLTTQEGPVG